MNVKNSGLGSQENDDLIKKLKKELGAEMANLKIKVQDAARQQKYRAAKNQKMKEVIDNIPAAAEILKRKSTPGRPRIEDNQPDFQERLLI